jgi:hypothetical protein
MNNKRKKKKKTVQTIICPVWDLRVGIRKALNLLGPRQGPDAKKDLPLAVS